MVTSERKYWTLRWSDNHTIVSPVDNICGLKHDYGMVFRTKSDAIKAAEYQKKMWGNDVEPCRLGEEARG